RARADERSSDESRSDEERAGEGDPRPSPDDEIELLGERRQRDEDDHRGNAGIEPDCCGHERIEQPGSDADGTAPEGGPARLSLELGDYGVTVIATGAIVVPGVWSDVSEASEGYVPGSALLKSSRGIDTMPPRTGAPRTGRYSVLFAGAAGMFLPLEPSRFSAPQLIPVPGSPAAPSAVPYA